MTREITHMKAFMLGAGEHGQGPASSIGQIPPTPELVNQYFNDSTGEGEQGGVKAKDFRGPWNEGGDWKYVEAPAFQQLRDLGEHGRLPSEAAKA